MLIFDSVSGDLISVIVALIVIFIVYFKWSYQYWKRRNLQYLEPRIPFGNIPATKEHIGIRIKRLYNIMKEKNWKYGGIYIFNSPAYLVIDLECLKKIMAKDFQYFTDRGIYYNETDDPLSANLFRIGGTKWKNLRTKLSPTFTSGKMKMMFQTLVDCEANLRGQIEAKYKTNEAIDIKEVLGCFTTDIIGSCAFGLDCKTFEEENSPFREYGKKVFLTTFLEKVKRSVALILPSLARALGLVMTPKDVTHFFMTTVKDMVDYREKNNVTRNDFMQLLIDLKNNKLAEEDGYRHDGNTLTIEEIAAQSFVFFIAGFETSSTTMAFALYELAKNQDIQEKVRDEVNSILTKHGGKITYDSIMDMKFMNQVLDETLRKYPPVTVLTRQCVKDYKIPDEDIVIEKGTLVMISVLGIHYDEEYYPEPEKFDPDRFSEEKMNSRHNYSHIPFGEGPRICIGMRFGLMQSKVGLASLLQNFKFTINNKTEEPLKMKINSVVLAAEGEIWLNAQEI